jgi:hypothetical protein
VRRGAIPENIVAAEVTLAGITGRLKAAVEIKMPMPEGG